MDNLSLNCTAEEIEWVAISLPAHVVWPPPDQASLLKELPGEHIEHPTAGGPRFRASILSSLGEDTDLEITVSDLWLLDSLFLDQDLRAAKMPDGTLLREFANKVWALIAQAYQDDPAVERVVHIATTQRLVARKADSHAEDEDLDAHASA